MIALAWLFGSSKRRSGDTADDDDDSQVVEAPYQYKDCCSFAEKLVWVQSTRGQNKLAVLPVLNEFYKNGRLYSIMKNKHWNQRLNEWFHIPTTGDDQQQHTTTTIDKSIPYGLALPIPEALKERKRVALDIHHNNPPIWDMFHSHPSFMQPFELTSSHKYDILTDGFTIFRNIIPNEVLNKADIAISNMIINSEQFSLSHEERAKEGLDVFFTEGGTNNPDVISLYYNSPIYALVESLLHNDNDVGSKRSRSDQSSFQPRTGGAQVAFRFSQARPPPSFFSRVHSSSSSSSDEKKNLIGGRSWHIDGMDRGTYGAFSLLIGVALSDQLTDTCGNLCLHPGSHHLLKAYMKAYAKACDDTQVDKGDISALQAHRLNAVSILRANKPTLEEPIQVKLSRGDVVFAMHKVAHLGGPNYSPNIRKMVYFRVSHRNLHIIRDDALDNLWLEYEGMKDVL